VVTNGKARLILDEIDTSRRTDILSESESQIYCVAWP